MYLLSYVPQPARQKKFDLRMDIFYIIFQNEFSGIYLAQNLIQGFCKRIKFFCSQKADGFKHPDMGF